VIYFQKNGKGNKAMLFNIETDRLMLSSIQSDSAMLVTDFYRRNLSWLSDYEPNLSTQYMLDDFNEAILKYEFDKTRNGSFIRYWFSLKNEPNRLLGTVVFQNIMHGPFKKCEIGYKLDRFDQGKGYAYEACDAAIRSIIAEERLHRIYAMVEKTNKRSIALIERLSFANEGMIKDYVQINGTWRDCLIYSLRDRS